MVVDELLPQWLRAVELQPGSERQSAIGQAAKNIAGNSTGSVMTGLILVAHGHVDEEAFGVLRDEILSIDSTFGSVATDLETQIAAAACVAEAMERSARIASIAAHGVLSADWIGLKSHVQELPELARRAVDKRSESERGRIQIPTLVEIDAALASVPSFPDDANPLTHQEAREMSRALVSCVEGLKKASERLSRRVTSRLSAGDEELDILWWAFSGVSELADGKRWTQIQNHGAACMLMAVELTRSIRFSAEPPSTRALLQRLLGARAEHEIELPSAIGAAGKLDVSVDLQGGQPLLPVLSCLSEYHAMNGKKGWRDSVERWSINPEMTTTCLELACQTIREILLNRDLSK